MKFVIKEDLSTWPAVKHSNKTRSTRQGYSEKTIRLFIENKDERWEDDVDEVDLNIVSIDLAVNEKTVNLGRATTTSPISIKPFDVDDSVNLGYEYIIEQFNDKNGTQLESLKGGTITITNEYEVSVSNVITF